MPHLISNSIFGRKKIAFCSTLIVIIATTAAATAAVDADAVVFISPNLLLFWINFSAENMPMERDEV